MLLVRLHVSSSKPSQVADRYLIYSRLQQIILPVLQSLQRTPKLAECEILRH